MTPIRYLRQFWGYAGARILVIVALTMLMSYAEGIGIALFFPLFAQGGGGGDALSSSLVGVFRWLHVPFTPAGALPIIGAIFVGKGFLQYATTIYQLRLTHRSVGVLRRRLLAAIGRADYAHMIGSSAGGSAQLVVNEVGRAAGGFLYYVRSIPPAINAGVLFLIVLYLDWRLTLVCVAMGLTMIALLRVSGRIAHHYSSVATAESGRLTSLVVQTLQAYKYLRTTGTFPRLENRVLAASDRHLDADFRSSSAGAVMLSAAQPIMVLFLGAVLYYRAAVQGEALAPLFVVLMYFFRIMTEIFTLQTSWQTFCSHMGSVDVIADAIARTERNAEPRGSRAPALPAGALAAEGVSFAYPTGRNVLSEVELKIAPHTTVAFVGASGSGKSTLVDVLTGTLKPTQGRVTVDGVDLRELDLDALRTRVGYVPQDSMVFDDTVASNLTLWRDVDAEAMRAAARRAHCLEFIEAMPGGFQAPIGERGTLLSGGQRQRLAIARELIKAPDILVLDEATSALDSASERAIQASIDELKGQLTILIIAHRLSTVRSCDRIYVLHEGRVVEEGRYEELVARPGSRFRQMVELQQLGDGSEAQVAS